MAETKLNTTTNPGTQNTAQDSSIQATGQFSAGGTRSSGIQPGTSTSVLDGGERTAGVPLGVATQQAIPLTGKTQTVAVTKPAAREIKPELFAVSGVLLVAAVVLFWLTGKSEKTTT
jgi:hypothetical protein